MSTYRIAEAADLAGVPASTLRYYEDAGVIARPSRGDNGYRSYTDRDIDRLRFVARAKQLNLGIGHLRELVDAWETDDCSSVQHRMAEVVATALRNTQRQVADLIELATQLQTVASRLDASPVAGPCDDNCPCITQTPMSAQTRDTHQVGHGNRNGSIAVGCSLDPAAAQRRVDEWQAVLAKAVARTGVDGGVVLQFGADADTAAELGRLAVAEHACCGFLAFSLRVAGPVLEFEVRAPAEAADVVDVLFTPAA